jgi:hypothetical protein
LILRRRQAATTYFMSLPWVSFAHGITRSKLGFNSASSTAGFVEYSVHCIRARDAVVWHAFSD